MIGLSTPRWGGSYEQMLALAAAAPIATNPKLKVLPGYVDLDLASMARLEKRDEEALAHDERALRNGPYWEFQLDKAKTLVRLERYREALEAVDLSIRQRPQKARAHATRATALGNLGKWIEAADAAAYACTLDAFEPDVHGIDEWVAAGLIREATMRERTDPAAALKFAEKAVWLVPGSKGAQRLCERLRTRGGGAEPGSVP
jgi:tetratricopeptide (TPR) repeat protein